MERCLLSLMDWHTITGTGSRVFSRKIWRDFWQDPKEALDSLRTRRKRLSYPIVNFFVFTRVVFGEYAQNHCLTRAAALAFALLLTLIPLISSVAFMLASSYELRPHQVERLFALLLPFAPPTVLSYIGTFFVNAQKLRGIGIGTLILVTVGLFGTVEESLNTIWKVTHARSFFVRLRTFTMVIVYSPILFIASFQFRRSTWLDLLSGYFFPIDILPFLLMVLAFTSLIFFVPNTKVRFRSAFMGGLIAGILFEIERQGFGTYVSFSIQTQTIYGAFGILPLFILSLFFVAIFVLFGAQVAYVYQNYRPLLRTKKRWDRRVGDYRTYITLRMMIDVVAAFLKKKRPPSLPYFMTKYELTDAQASGLLKWLVHAGFLHNVSGKDSYVPTRDFSQTPVKDVLDAIEDQNRRIPTTPNDYTRDYMETLLEKAKIHSGTLLEDLTFEAMIAELDQGEVRAAKVAAMT